MNFLAKGLIFITFFLPIVSTAQSKLYVSGIAGQYSMKGIKEFQQELNYTLVSSGFPTKVVTDFPISLQVEIGFDKTPVNDPEYSIGGYLNYAIAKGRVHYGDYSGETFGNQNISRFILGGKASTHLPHGFEFYGKCGLNYSMLELEFVTNVYGIGSESEALEFYSIGINVEPGFLWYYNHDPFMFSVQVGYEFNIQGKTFFKEDHDAYLLNQEGDIVKIDWSGMRLGLGMAYRLKQ